MNEKLIDYIMSEYKEQLAKIFRNATSDDPTSWMCQLDEGISNFAYELQDEFGYDDENLKDVDPEELEEIINEALCSI